MKTPPWDQRIARVLVKPLVKSPVTPNQMTMFTLAVALAGAGLLATGDAVNADWGAGLFVLARFLDHFDGELARQKDMTSRLGYYLDYALGPWAIVLSAAGAASAVVSMFTNLGIDKQLNLDEDAEHDAVGYPGFAGFELEDGIYLLAPITWAGFLMPFFVAAGIGAGVYCLWTCWTLLRLRRG